MVYINCTSVFYTAGFLGNTRILLNVYLTILFISFNGINLFMNIIHYKSNKIERTDIHLSILINKFWIINQIFCYHNPTIWMMSRSISRNIRPTKTQWLELFFFIQWGRIARIRHKINNICAKFQFRMFIFGNKAAAVGRIFFFSRTTPCHRSTVTFVQF